MAYHKIEAAHISSCNGEYCERRVIPGRLPHFTVLARYLVYHSRRIGVLLQRWSTIMNTKPGLIIAFIISLALVAACGQKGPLFLPGSPSQMGPERADPQAAPVEESDEDDEDRTDNIN
jgi:predicted small lipoprotein YifL